MAARTASGSTGGAAPTHSAPQKTRWRCATDMTGPVKAKYDDLILNKDLTPIRRWGQPADVARAIVAIATDLLPFSTGEVINVDGGFHMRRL